MAIEQLERDWGMKQKENENTKPLMSIRDLHNKREEIEKKQHMQVRGTTDPHTQTASIMYACNQISEAENLFTQSSFVRSLDPDPAPNAAARDRLEAAEEAGRRYAEDDDDDP